jgi:hypothetical protein
MYDQENFGVVNVGGKVIMPAARATSAILSPAASARVVYESIIRHKRPFNSMLLTVGKEWGKVERCDYDSSSLSSLHK